MKKTDLYNIHSMEELGRIGSWEINLSENKLYWSNGTFDIHEVTSQEYSPTVESAINFYHPDDRPIIQEAVQKAIENKEMFRRKLRIITAKDNLRWIECNGKIFYENGVAVKIFGSIHDITDHQNTLEQLYKKNYELEYATILENLFDPFHTTKSRGKGNGLGLWISESILKSIGGTIEVQSQVGHGAKFLVKLPQKSPKQR